MSYNKFDSNTIEGSAFLNSDRTSIDIPILTLGGCFIGRPILSTYSGSTINGTQSSKRNFDLKCNQKANVTALEAYTLREYATLSGLKFDNDTSNLTRLISFDSGGISRLISGTGNGYLTSTNLNGLNYMSNFSSSLGYLLTYNGISTTPFTVSATVNLMIDTSTTFAATDWIQ